MELRTERLILRKARLDDLAEVKSFMGHAGAMQYWSTPPHADLERTRAWLQAHIEADPEISLNYLIEFEGRVIGEVGSFPIPEFGFILHPDYWGRGIGLEAGRAVIDHLFATRSVDSLVADVDPRNASSIALLAKLGFLKTGEARGTLCVGGEWVDSEYYGLARPV